MKNARYLFLGLCGLFLAASVHASSELNKEREDLFAPILQDARLQVKLMNNSKTIPENFNYAALFGADVDVLLVGEEHHDSIPARDINLMIKNLAQSQVGLTHVAVEFLLSSEQPFLDAFAAGKISYEELREKCKLEDRTFVAEIAKRYKVRVVGLDMPRAQEDYQWAMSYEGLTARNRAWVAKILAIKKQNPRAKILLHAGSFHTQLSAKYGPTVPQLLKQNGLTVKTVEFVSPNDKHVWGKLNIGGKYDRLFTIPSDLKPYVRADYVVYSAMADYTKEEQTQIKAAIDSIFNKSKGNIIAENGCLLDPDNPACQLIINTGRVKLK